MSLFSSITDLGDASFQKERVKELGCLLQDRIDAMYVDKLEGKISEAFFTRKSEEWKQPAQRKKYGTESTFSLDRSIIALLYIKQTHVKI